MTVPPANPPEERLEVFFQRLTVALCLVSGTLMLVGLVGYALVDGQLADPSAVKAVTFGELWVLDARSWPLHAMTAGILLLALLPTVRVVTVVWKFAHQRRWVEVAVSLAVLLELLSSLHAGRH